MADNITLNQNASSGAVLATDDISSVHYQVVKLAHGADGSATLVSTASGLPVAQQGTWTIVNAGTFAVQVDGNLLTAAQLLDDAVVQGGAAVGSAKSFLIAGYDGTNTQFISTNSNGHLNIADGGNTITVDGTVAISGSVTVAQATAANLNVTEVNSGGMSVSLGLIDDAVTQDGTAYNASNHKGLIVAGYDGTNLQLISTNSSGHLNAVVTNAGGFGVTDGGGTLTVDNGGTFAVQAAQSGTWTVQPGNTANSTAWLVTGTGGTFPVTDSGGSLTVDNGGSFAVQVSSIAAGDNNIGNFDLASAIPAGTNLIGIASASAETSTIYNGSTALTPKFAAIDVASSGDNTLLTAVASKKIRVHALYLVAAGAVNARFESGAGGTALSGQMNLAANSGFVLPFNPVGWFETASNTLLNLELSGAVSVDGSLVYSEV